MTPTRRFLPLAVTSTLVAASCSSQASQWPAAFTITAINGRPLPFTDSVPVGGVLAPVQEFRVGKLAFTSPHHAEISTTYKDFVIARFPCELQRDMRDAALGSSSSAGELKRLQDTATTGCDDLSVVTHTVVLRYRQVGDSLYLFEGEESLGGVWRGDTIVLKAPGLHPKTLVAVRDRVH